MTEIGPAAAFLQLQTPADALQAEPARGEAAAFAELLAVRPGGAEAGDAERRISPYTDLAHAAGLSDPLPGAELKAFLDVEFQAQATGSAFAVPLSGTQVYTEAPVGPAGETAAPSSDRAGHGAVPGSSAHLAAAAESEDGGSAAAQAQRASGTGLLPSTRGVPVRRDMGGFVLVQQPSGAHGFPTSAPQTQRGGAARPVPAETGSSTQNAATSLHLAVQASAAGLDVLVRPGPMSADDRARLKSEVAALLAAHGLRIHTVEIVSPGFAARQKEDT